MTSQIQSTSETISITEQPSEVEKSHAEQYQQSFGEKIMSSWVGDVAVAVDEFASGLFSLVGVGIQTGTAVTGVGCTPVEEEPDTRLPILDVEFVGDNDTHYGSDNNRYVIYNKSNDEFCNGEMQFDLILPNNSGSVIPKVYVGYYSDESGWESRGEDLNGLVISDIIDIGHPNGNVVSMSDNITETDDPNVFEFTYVPAADDLGDHILWSFNLFFVVTDGEIFSNYPEQWFYYNVEHDAERSCD